MEYTLVTRNEKEFDEQGVTRTFDDLGHAIRMAKAFMKKATCAGASAIIFHRGFTMYEQTTQKSWVRA